LVFVAVGIVICLNINAGVLRKYFAQSLKSSSTSSKESKATKMDKETLIQNVCIAVKWLSENRVGALITFEKETPLDDFMRNGTTINCPFTPEIVETIFYEGTRLHDGAVIIRNDQIVAASVYYTPTTRPLTGKYGSRHRAAIGVSEICDAVTVVVSEETGRISIAYKGELQTVGPDAFLSTFEDLMLQVETLD
jgi:diadenylate cyclase